MLEVFDPESLRKTIRYGRMKLHHGDPGTLGKDNLIHGPIGEPGLPQLIEFDNPGSIVWRFEHDVKEVPLSRARRLITGGSGTTSKIVSRQYRITHVTVWAGLDGDETFILDYTKSMDDKFPMTLNSGDTLTVSYRVNLEVE